MDINREYGGKSSSCIRFDLKSNEMSRIENESYYENQKESKSINLSL